MVQEAGKKARAGVGNAGVETAPCLGGQGTCGVDWNALFYPRTMAVIGASRNPVGAVKYVKAHLPTPIKVFPVNTNPGLVELEGLPVYRSVLDIKEDVDIAIIGVPKEHVPAVAREVRQKGVKFAVIFSSGFKESGNDDLDVELREAIRGGPTRFIGPNCLGVYHPRGNLMYFPGLPVGPEASGNVSVLAQSGGHTAKALSFLRSKHALPAKIISIGNAIDLTPADFLDYFRTDDDTDVVGLYLESTRNGKALMDALRATTPVKPVVIWKGGTGRVGFKATASHTGELAGSWRIWQAMARQVGSIIVPDFYTFADLLVALSFKLPLPASNRVALVACGGGNAVEAGDIFESLGFEIPPLSDETKEKIYEFIPDVNTYLGNPVDLGEYGYVPKNFAKAIEIIATDENIDSIVYIKESQRFPLFSVNFFMSYEEYERSMVRELARATKRVAKARNIPLYCNDPYLAEDGPGYQCRVSFKEKLAAKGIPVFSEITFLGRAMRGLVEYRGFLDTLDERGAGAASAAAPRDPPAAKPGD